MSKLFVSGFLFLMMFWGVANAQDMDPGKTYHRKDQYSESSEKIEKKSEKDMNKQINEFDHKKRYGKEIKKGKRVNKKKVQGEALIWYSEKKKWNA